MRKTLIILTPGFPENEADTTCITDRQIFVRVLKETYPDLNIVVVAFQYPLQPREYEWKGIKVISLGGKNKSGLYRRVTWKAARDKLAELNNQTQVIGLLSFWLDECALIADKFARKHTLKHFCWLLGQDARPGNKYVEMIKTDGTNLIALSDFIVDEFSKNYNIIPKHVVPGAIDPTLFNGFAGGRYIDVMGAGSLISLKQHGVFIDIINSLKTDMPQVKAVICGKGPQLQALKNKVKDLGLEDNINLLGELPNAEVLELMQHSKVFLHTSQYEGFGIVCLEALYAGAKVISFVKPMNVEIKNWHIVKDVKEMQQQVSDLLRDETLDHERVLFYKTQDAAKAVMALFS